MPFKSFLSEGEGVKYLELGDVCEIHTGVRFGTNSYRDTGFPIVEGKSIQDGQIVTDNLHYCDPQNHVDSPIIKYGDIVMANVGSPGKVGINLTDREFFFSDRIFKFVPDEKRLINKYLYHFLLSQQEKIKGLLRGSSQPFVRKAELKQLKIPIPSLEVQERVSSALDKFREIEREINLRDKQYEYYRNYLITGSCSNR